MVVGVRIVYFFIDMSHNILSLSLTKDIKRSKKVIKVYAEHSLFSWIQSRSKYHFDFISFQGQ